MRKGMATAECACGWEGRRIWPSPVKPCPHCGSTKIARAILAPRGNHRSWRRNVNWEED